MRQAIAAFFVLLCRTAACGRFADAIIRAVPKSGQDDDIMVLTPTRLALAPVPVA